MGSVCKTEPAGDTWITLNDGGNTHTIRFGSNDSLAIAEIQPFVDKLEEIKVKIDTP